MVLLVRFLSQQFVASDNWKGKSQFESSAERLHATPVARTGANSIIYFQKVEMELIRIHFFINSQLFNTQIRKIRVATLWVFIVWVVRKREGSFLGIAVKLRWFLVTVASSFTICRLL